MSPMIWLHPQKNPNLPVYPSQPTDNRPYYHCPVCKGWIPGYPDTDEIDTISPLAGRRGTVELCRRCGEEIGFTGEVS